MDGGRRVPILPGLPIGEHLQRLKPSTAVFRCPTCCRSIHQSPFYNEAARVSMFYAESWALTHMILNGQPNRVAELERVTCASWLTVLPRRVRGKKRSAPFEPRRTSGQYLTRDRFNTVVIDFTEKIAAAVGDADAAVSPADLAAAFLGQYLVRHGRVRRSGRSTAAGVQRPIRAICAPRWRWRSSTSSGKPALQRRKAFVESREEADQLAVVYGAAMAMTDLVADWHGRFCDC